MSQGWTYCIAGIGFCLAGGYLFFKNSYEEGRTVFYSILLMIAGVILIGVGTATALNLM
jgi:hypothetical protein